MWCTPCNLKFLTPYRPLHITRFPAVYHLPQVSSPKDIMGAEKLIFPGVGAFEQAMGVLRSKEYTEPLREYIQASSPSQQVPLTRTLLYLALLTQCDLCFSSMP